MLNTYIFNPDNRGAIKQVAASNREFASTIREISDNEIKSKNRVNITLEEYERMKDEIQTLKSLNHSYKRALEEIEFPVDILLDNRNIVNNFHTYYSENPIHFKRRYRIEFDVDMFEFKNRSIF